MKDEKVYTVHEAAAIVFQNKVSARLLYKLFHQGKLTGYRVGGRILLYEAGLLAYRHRTENNARSEV